MIVPHDHVEFILRMQECFNTQKTVSVIHYVNKIKEKKSSSWLMERIESSLKNWMVGTRVFFYCDFLHKG